MKAVAIIPARAGSKGVPGKNMRPLLGKTLVQRSIEHAQEARCIEAVLVSSDSAEILEHAERMGATPIARPNSLATDDAATDPVMVHAIKAAEFERLPEWTVLLQPTSPVREHRVIDRSVRKAASHACASVFTAFDAHFAWRRSFGVPKGDPFLLNCLLADRKPRQRVPDQEKVYVENGAVYVTKTERLLETGQRLVSPMEIIEMSRADSIDIDCEYDFYIAETRLRFLERSKAA